ncbi:MAG: alpha-amylase family glycosyl hydrolase, partial [Saprospiraceae bacterium]
MKFFNSCSLIAALFYLISYPSAAQGINVHHRNSPVIWTIPAFPTKLDDVTVYFDASQGNAALSGFTGEVYAHTGVITNLSTSSSDWKHVIGNWGTADSRVLMKRESPNIYSISYNISTFYGIPANEDVLQMAFVFRNVSGTIVGRDADGSDLYTNVAAANAGLLLTLREPSDGDVILYEGDSLNIDIAINDTASLMIFDDQTLIYSDIVDHAIFFYHPINTGQHVLRFEATKDSTVILEKEYYVLKNNPVKINPPNGTVNGLNYFSDTTYLFQLHAPLKEYVFLLCPQNNFQPDSNFQMHEGDDLATYWIELPRSWFADGKNTYQYLISGGIRVADPLSEVVLDRNNDTGVKPSVMATLPPYPVGMTNGIVTAFDEDRQPFNFVVEHFDKPEKTKLVIYELLIRDFLATHSFTTLLDTLDYFSKLGINAIELMPIGEFEGNNSWGYNVSFPMAVDKYYGTREQLKKFIDAAHQRGIAVILDVVFNHVFGQSPLAQMYWDPVNSRPSAESPYLNPIAKHPFNVGYDMNHESAATKSWVKRILSYWISDFKFDGFRFDLSKGFTQFNSGTDAGLMAKYDASRIAILKDYANSIWSHDTSGYVILEHFAENNEETVLSNYGMMLWDNINYQFSQAAKGFSSDLEGIDYTFKGWNDPHAVGYMESHDEERMMYRLLNEGDSNVDYNTRNPATALERIAAASTIFYLVPGPKMIWEFGELGFDFSINRCTNGTMNNNCRLDPKPIRWDYLLDATRKKLHDVVASVIYLKENYSTFSTHDFEFNDANFFVKLIHLNDPVMDATVIANFRIINSDVIPKFQHTGIWYEYFTGDSLVVTDTEKRITFKPGEYRIYTSKRITPPNGFFTVIRHLDAQHIDIYPSLVTDDTTIHGSLPEEYKIESITVSDITGKRIESSYTLTEDGFNLMLSPVFASGIYIINVQTQNAYYV